MYYDLASNEMVEAKNNLAGLYFEDKNYEKAIKNYDEAIADGCKVSIENIGDLYDQMDDVEKAISYYLRNSTTVDCQVKLGDIYKRIENIDEAIVWYEKAIENGDTYSVYSLACLYEELKDYEKAKEYFLMAVEKNHVNSRIHLGRIYYNEGDYENSKIMLDVTANEENIYSQHMVGLIYENFYNDDTNAKYWYEKAREQGCIESTYNLGQLALKQGDIEESEKYFTEGFKQEDKNCEFMLAYILYEKSKKMFKELSDIHYDDSERILNTMPVIEINKKERLVASFEEIVNGEDDEDEYIPKYILEVNENIEDEFEGIESTMKIER